MPVSLASFQAMRLLTSAWMDPRGGSHGVLPVSFRGNSHLLEGWALLRPDGSRSLLLINNDASHPARISVRGMAKKTLLLTTYSRAEYIWHPDGRNGHPSRNLRPAKTSVPSDLPVTIPPWSLAVLKEE